MGSWHQVAQVLELQLHYQSFQWILRVDFLRIDQPNFPAVQGTSSSVPQLERITQPSHIRIQPPDKTSVVTVLTAPGSGEDSPRWRILITYPRTWPIIHITYSPTCISIRDAIIDSTGFFINVVSISITDGGACRKICLWTCLKVLWWGYHMRCFTL